MVGETLQASGEETVWQSIVREEVAANRDSLHGGINHVELTRRLYANA